MLNVTSEIMFNEMIANEKPTVALFKADWCVDCHYIDPFLADIVEAYADRFNFIQVDRDEWPELCERYNILGIPSFIVFKQGQAVTHFVSKLRKTREEIEQFLEKSALVATQI